MTVTGKQDGGHSSVGDWPPARISPETYPGDCPPGHYLLCSGHVFPLAENGADIGYDVIRESGRRDELDSYLSLDPPTNSGISSVDPGLVAP